MSSPVEDWCLYGMDATEFVLSGGVKMYAEDEEEDDEDSEDIIQIEDDEDGEDEDDEDEDDEEIVPEEWIEE